MAALNAAALAAPRQPEALLAWMESLSDPTRLRLLRILERQELGVAELVRVLQLPQSSVSRHLKVLADQGWVESRGHRTTNLYRMAGGANGSAARRLWLLAREQTESWPTVRHDELRLTRLLARREPPSRAFFAGAARHWDRLREELYGRAFEQEAILALLPPGLVVADLGCGTGTLAAALSRHVARVIAVDQSPAMLRAARRRTAGLPNVELRRGELERLPVETGECDAALLLLALSYVAEPARVVREMARIVRPGGRAVAVDLLRHDREDFRRDTGQVRLGFEPSELGSLLEAAGLHEVSCRPLPPEAKARGPALVLAAGARPARKPDRRRERRKDA
jgi:ArsR family transcriptional regulator